MSASSTIPDPPEPRNFELVCPQCGEKAIASEPFAIPLLDISPAEIPAVEAEYRRRGHAYELNTDSLGRVHLWYFPEFFNQWPEGGFPGGLKVCECSHCGFRGKHRYKCASLSELWGIDEEMIVSHCPICGDGPWEGEPCTIGEVAGSYWICPCCSCEYGDDDTPEHREKWLAEAATKFTPEELVERKSHMIMNWNVLQGPMWKFLRPVPLDAEGGIRLK